MTDDQLLEARAAFIKKVKKDEEFTEAWCKTSFKQHWTGALGGFARDGVQRRWSDFLAGWQAAQAKG